MLYQVETTAFAWKRCCLVRHECDFPVYDKVFPFTVYQFIDNGLELLYSPVRITYNTLISSKNNLQVYFVCGSLTISFVVRDGQVCNSHQEICAACSYDLFRHTTTIVMLAT